MNHTEFLQRLGRTEAGYELEVFEYYFKWCETYSYSDKTHQILLSSPTMFAWWRKELAFLEDFIKQIAKDNPNLTKMELRPIYNRQIIKISHYYPKAKLAKILGGQKPIPCYHFRSHLQTLN